MKKMFTEEGVAKMKPPATGRVEYGDAYLSGLMLRVTSGGVKSWSVLYKVKGEGGTSPTTGRRLKGTQRRLTLGTFPAMGVKQARAEAAKVMQKAWDGNDTRKALAEAHATRASNVFEEVTRRFLDQEAKPNIDSWKKMQRSFELHVFPKWGARLITDIRRSDVHGLLDEFVEMGRAGTARDVRKHLSRLFNWCLDREIINESPLAGLKRKDLQQNPDAGRALSDDELRAIWRAADQLNYPFGPYFQLMILTGQRRNEWAHARHSELDVKRRVLEIPKARYKSKRDHLVPLATEALAILASMPKWAGLPDPYLFSTQDGEVPVSGFSKAKKQLDELALVEFRKALGDPKASIKRYRIHDFRVTCESRLADLGFNQDVRDAVLGHAKIGLQRTYNKYDYADEKRKALDAYAKHILGLVG